MPKRNVRVDIPVDSPDKLSELIKEVWEQHQELGVNSPLNNLSFLDMAQFEAMMTEALDLRKQAKVHHGKWQKLMQHSRKLLGTDVGQKIGTEGTLYFMLDIIRRYLMVKHQNDEEAISEWGFNVVISSSSVGRKRKKKA